MIDDFVRIFELPPAMIPHIDFVVQGREMELVVDLGKHWRRPPPRRESAC